MFNFDVREDTEIAAYRFLTFLLGDATLTIWSLKFALCSAVTDGFYAAPVLSLIRFTSTSPTSCLDLFGTYFRLL